MKNRVLICSTALLFLFLTGCQHPGPRFDPYAHFPGSAADLSGVTVTNQLNPDLLRPPSEPFTLGPGDRLEIEELEETNSRAISEVGPDGKIYFYLLPGLDVWGLTLPQTRSLLEQNLSQFMREPPHVSLVLRGVESRRIWLLGRVQTPGVYYMTNSTTLLEAIALAGGTQSSTGTKELAAGGVIEELADLRRSFVVRKGRALPVDFHRLVVEGDLSQNIYLEPDDFVYFPPATAKEVYVIGAVGQPRAVPYMEGMTLASAIANCYGTAKEAYLSHVAVVRGSLTEPKVAIIDYKSVIKGETPDVLLQPHDIVYVPYEPYRYLVRYVNLIVNTFASSVAINEGARAVSANFAPAGVFLPIGGGATAIPVTPIK
ncbi:MAG: Polysaccharide export protein [Pedosphaera sp.]|nr:Polysaccharide export protein [Pedosphaera sp.]